MLLSRDKSQLLIIDVQYRTVGTVPKPFWESIKEFPTSCGEVAWAAVRNIQVLLAEFRKRRWPVLYPHVAPKQATDGTPRLELRPFSHLKACDRDALESEGTRLLPLLGRGAYHRYPGTD